MAAGWARAAGITAKNAGSDPISSVVRTGWVTPPLENAPSACAIASIRSGIARTRRTSCSVRSTGIGKLRICGTRIRTSHLTHDRRPHGRRAPSPRHGGLARAQGPDDARAARLGENPSGSPPPRADVRAARARRHVRRPVHRARARRFRRRRAVHAQRGLQYDVRPRRHRRRHAGDRAWADHATRRAGRGRAHSARARHSSGPDPREGRSDRATVPNGA